MLTKPVENNKKKGRVLVVLGHVLINIAVVALGVSWFALYGTGIKTHQQQQELSKEFDDLVFANTSSSTTPASTVTITPTTAPVVSTPPSDPFTTDTVTEETTVPTSPTATGDPTTTTGASPSSLPAPSTTIPDGFPVAKMAVPAIGFNWVVVEGTSRSDLTAGPGHHLDSPWLGDTGNTVIAGHRTSHGAPFYDLDKIKPGDLISITDVHGKVWVYRVREVPFVVDDEEVAAIYAQGLTPELTLVTCTPVGSTAQRLVVKADLVEVPA